MVQSPVTAEYYRSTVPVVVDDPVAVVVRGVVVEDSDVEAVVV